MSECHPSSNRSPLSVVSEWFSVHKKNHLHMLKIISINFFYYLFAGFETESHSITQAGLELTLKPRPPRNSLSFCLCWDYKRHSSDSWLHMKILDLEASGGHRLTA